MSVDFIDYDTPETRSHILRLLRLAPSRGLSVQDIAMHCEIPLEDLALLLSEMADEELIFRASIFDRVARYVLRDPCVASLVEMPDAQWFLRRVRAAPCPGLVLLNYVGNQDQATAYLRALEDARLIRSTGSAVAIDSAWRGVLVGGMYEAVPVVEAPAAADEDTRGER